jgi:hypothetical protein
MVHVKRTTFIVEDDPDISWLIRHHLEAVPANVLESVIVKRIAE